ncbi:MAG: InlB B-repeat-containing protein [Methylococcaceae bacterium]
MARWEDSDSTGVDGDQNNDLTERSGAAYVFKLIQHNLTVNNTGTGSGNVSSSPAGINCGSDCSALYNLNTEVTLTALAAAGSEFTGWSGAGCRGTDTCDITLDAAKTVTANFDLDIAVAVETLWIPIESGADDAEENVTSGGISLTSSDLELTQDGSKQQKAGLRFILDIPAGATILSAAIQFTADEAHSKFTTLSVSAEATPNAVHFSNTKFDISHRTLVSKTVVWEPLPWTAIGEAGPDQQTPDLSSIVQAVVNQGAWAPGNAIAFIISGQGKRVAESYNGTAAPELHVEYSTVASVPNAVTAKPFNIKYSYKTTV